MWPREPDLRGHCRQDGTVFQARDDVFVGGVQAFVPLPVCRAPRGVSCGNVGSVSCVRVSPRLPLCTDCGSQVP